MSEHTTASNTAASQTTPSSSETLPAFQLKGGLFPLTSLQLLNPSLKLLGAQLDQKLQQAPKFFFNAPMVIDLQKVNRLELAIDFKQLKEILLNRHLVPVGVRNGNAHQHSEASKLGFAILQETAKEQPLQSQQARNEQAHATNEQTTKEQIQQAILESKVLDSKAISSDSKAMSAEERESKESDPDVHGSNTRIITEPVRSGQQIYVRGGDLIVLAPVSHGAELLADGNIHVYGPLRGRALAGVTGDVQARIFCQCLEAELISIAGQYKISEDLQSSDWRSAVTIYLEDGRLQIKVL